MISQSLLLLPLLACFALSNDDATGWTGALDEAAFAALHELKEGEAPELRGELIEIGEDRAYLSWPPTGPVIGGIVVIHEWWGLNDHVMHWTDRLAADGYAAVAVDLYGGVVATTREQAMEAMQSVDEGRALSTLRAAHALLVSDERVQAERTASIGWCFGGGMSLKLALHEPELNAAILYYGRLVQDPEELASIEAPILGVFGNKDSSIPVESVDAFETAMREAGKSIEIAQYDAEHAFANPSSARYDAEHAAHAWERSRAFLAKHLMPAPQSGSYARGTRTLEMWTPEGWEEQEPSAMRLRSFRIGSATECVVSALLGNGGGMEPNLNRWRSQMGADVLQGEEIEALPRIPMLGRMATTIRINGTFTSMSGDSIEDATLLGAVCELEDETVFVKLVGPSAEVEAELAVFAAFCRSLR